MSGNQLISVSIPKYAGARGAAPVVSLGGSRLPRTGSLKGWNSPNIFIFPKKKCWQKLFFSYNHLKCMPENVNKFGLKKKILLQFWWFFLYVSTHSKKKKISRKKIVGNFFLHFLSVFWNVCIFIFGEIRAKTKSFRRNFLTQNQMKILLNTKQFKKNRKLFFNTFQNIVYILGPKSQFGHFCREEGRSSWVGSKAS